MKTIRLVLFPLLWPLSLVYGFVVFIRNKCYDYGVFQVYKIPGKSICVGNLSTGGTGKTPHTALLASWFADSMKTSILSRGYGRKSKGFLLLNEQQTAAEVGDEPLFYKMHFGDNVQVAVCESRKDGVENILNQFPGNQLIILDDAFQHRAVKAGFSILLTDFSEPYSIDFVLPAGNLREWKSGRKRADVVVVTKCPEHLETLHKQQLIRKLRFDPDKIFFSRIHYPEMIRFGAETIDRKKILLVTGIANPFPLKNELEKHFEVELMRFGDHHTFTKEDIDKIHQKFDTFVRENSIIVTTEKDYMRLKDILNEWNMANYPWYYQPISVKIEKEELFKNLINQYVRAI